MAKAKYDIVVEAVRYKPGGEVDWVRGYERRGAVFSDRILIQRKDLIERIKSGKVVLVGRRVPLKASTFEVFHPIKVVTKGGREVLITGENQKDHDYLEGVPLI